MISEELIITAMSQWIAEATISHNAMTAIRWDADWPYDGCYYWNSQLRRWVLF